MRSPVIAVRVPVDLGVSGTYALPGLVATPGNRVRLLPGGAEAFPAMLAAIARARSEVLLESYIFVDDSTGRAFAAALKDAARRGCRVVFQCDAVGSLALPAQVIADLTATGVHAGFYRPLAPWHARYSRYSRFWRRNHRKTLVVDGSLCFLGGLNISDEYDDRIDTGRTWRDMHLEIEGPAAERLARLVLRTWNADALRADRVAGKRPVGLPLPDGIPLVVLGNREFRHRRSIRRAFMYAVQRAQRSVWVANPYFIPDWRVSRALRNAARRGVDVRVVVPARSDVLLCDLASRATFRKLLAAGVRIAEWEHGMMHTKAVAVDGAWATVGSYNFDHASLMYNLEATANLLASSAAGEVQARLAADFAASREITLEEHRDRPLARRILEQLAYRLRKLL